MVDICGRCGALAWRSLRGGRRGFCEAALRLGNRRTRVSAQCATRRQTLPDRQATYLERRIWSVDDPLARNAVAQLENLYRVLLLEPVAKYLAGVKRLINVPYGPAPRRAVRCGRGHNRRRELTAPHSTH